MPINSKRTVLLTFTLLLTGVVLVTAVRSRTKQLQITPPAMPPVYSIVNEITVEGARVVNEGTPAVGVELIVRNTTDKPVVAVDLVAGEGAVTKNGLTDEEHPIVVIEPHGTTTLFMNYSAMTPCAPLVVSAITYADGTNVGDEKSIRLMKKAREHDRAVMKEIREKQKRTP